MRKIIAVILSVIMLLSITPTVFAGLNKKGKSDIPVILVGGDGDPLYDTDGNKIFEIDELGEAVSGSSDGNVYEALANIMLPFVLEGITFGKWDNYYTNLQKELSDMFDKIICDENGDAKYGTDVSKAHRESNEFNRQNDKKGTKGYYALNDYTFYYDWRLDPIQIADELHAYIEDIKKVTNQDEVSLLGRCLGSDVVLAYIAKYGTDGIHGVGIGATVANGSEMISEAISGKFEVDGNAISRFMTDLDHINYVGIEAYLISTVNLLQKSGVLSALTSGKVEEIYYQIVKGATSALALSTFLSMPAYWAMVTTEDYEDAMLYVFGEEGSEKRTRYAGLIEKIEAYHEIVRLHVPEIMTEINDNCNLGITSKYGMQMLPICRSNDVVSDQFASVRRSSFGATTSSIYNTLSDEYIAEREALGLGKYISPDKQIDASTCMFPDQTWFVKGASHSKWTDVENTILYSVIAADEQLYTSEFSWGQYMVYSYETKAVSVMDETNCHTENWEAVKSEDEPQSKSERLFTFLKALFAWLKVIIAKIFG